MNKLATTLILDQLGYTGSLKYLYDQRFLAQKIFQFPIELS